MSAALALLRDLDEAHATMTRCAEALDWDGVAAAWRQAERDFAQLTQHRLEALPPEQRREASAHIERILYAQAAIVQRAKPWMEQVAPLLDNFTRHPLTPLEG